MTQTQTMYTHDSINIYWWLSLNLLEIWVSAALICTNNSQPLLHATIICLSFICIDCVKLVWSGLDSDLFQPTVIVTNLHQQLHPTNSTQPVFNTAMCWGSLTTVATSKQKNSRCSLHAYTYIKSKWHEVDGHQLPYFKCHRHLMVNVTAL